jgi:hypothetical protein
MPRKFFTSIDMQSVSKVVNLPSPTAAGDAVPKSYVDSAVEGLAWKASCRVATQANLNLASPGAAIDGITMAAQDRVLVRAQTAGADNGIYVWNGASTAMSRSLDCSTFDELEQLTPNNLQRKQVHQTPLRIDQQQEQLQKLNPNQTATSDESSFLLQQKKSLEVITEKSEFSNTTYARPGSYRSKASKN